MTTKVKFNSERKKLANLMLAVFRSVKFKNIESKRLLMDTYFLNLSSLVNYADNKQLDKTEYILGIRDSLLSSEDVCDLIPKLDLIQLVRFAESKKINAAYYLNALLNKKIQTEQDAKELVLAIYQAELDWRNGR